MPRMFSLLLALDDTNVVWVEFDKLQNLQQDKSFRSFIFAGWAHVLGFGVLVERSEIRGIRFACLGLKGLNHVEYLLIGHVESELQIAKSSLHMNILSRNFASAIFLCSLFIWMFSHVLLQ